MRNPKRIHIICTKFEEIWNKYPDMRFFQLIINLLGLFYVSDPWFIEDDKVEEIFDKFLKGEVKW